MDGIANIAKQQQTQVTPQDMHLKNATQSRLSMQESKMNANSLEKNQEAQQTNSNNQINSKKDVEDLVKKLNDAMTPLQTTIKFGVDENDIFYVAAIDEKTNRVIRRFPAEEAQSLLPKMQEVSGILFDSKG